MFWLIPLITAGAKMYSDSRNQNAANAANTANTTVANNEKEAKALMASMNGEAPTPDEGGDKGSGEAPKAPDSSAAVDAMTQLFAGIADGSGSTKKG